MRSSLNEKEREKIIFPYKVANRPKCKSVEFGFSSKTNVENERNDKRNIYEVLQWLREKRWDK